MNFAKKIVWLGVLLVLVSVFSPAPVAAQADTPIDSQASAVPEDAPPLNVRRLNVPYFPVADVINEKLPEMGVAWYGLVNNTSNYTDVRMGYNDTTLFIHIAVFDHYLVNSSAPTPAKLLAYDAFSLYLKLDGRAGVYPTPTSYRLDAQWASGSSRTPAYQAAYQGNGRGWSPIGLDYATRGGYRGRAFNNARGWTLDYRIPFASLGLSGKPDDGTVWGLAMVTHDRDTATGTITRKTWPSPLTFNRPATWGTLRFGEPGYTPPASANDTTITLRHGVNGVVISDASVGGSTVCGNGTDFWTRWGNTNEGFYNRLYGNVQNQVDVADWPCYSKFYISIPLNTIPTGKVIKSAALTLYHFGNSDPTQAKPSLIQVHTIYTTWRDTTITWNNAPLAGENFSAAWVDPLPEYPGSPGIERTWDVSYAAALAYARRQPLRLAFYSADFDYHSGKYFWTSQADEQSRPMLQITYGDPQ